MDEDFKSLSRENLQQIIQASLDIERRAKARAALDNRDRDEKPTWQERHSHKTLILAALAIVVTVVGLWINKEHKPAYKSTPISTDANAGSLVQGPGSVAQIGGSGNTAIVNNFMPSLRVKPSFIPESGH